MRNPAAQGRTDANQSDIIEAYEELYCLVHDTHALGGGFPDLVVRITTKRGHVMNGVEVKTADGLLRRSQETFIRTWGTGIIEVVRTREDVFAHVERVRSG